MSCLDVTGLEVPLRLSSGNRGASCDAGSPPIIGRWRCRSGDGLRPTRLHTAETEPEFLSLVASHGAAASCWLILQLGFETRLLGDEDRR